MKYKRGDKVKVREDLQVQFYGRYGANSLMQHYRGKTITIKSKSEKLGRYLIKEEWDCWFWTDEMFEEVQE